MLVENGTGDDVRFLPHLPQAEKMELMKTLSILSVPTTHPDAFGLYILEALATGVPVVQPDHGAFPELVQKTGGGILYKPNDGQALAAALEKLLGNPKKLQRLGEQGRKGVIRDFHIDDMADAYVRVYQEIVERSGRRRISKSAANTKKNITR
jgi:glycosyltransferase involved in cell wall biosynthesis